jgi:diadenosine tetraphosphate (Ap4A) HIT family hydrolase
MSSLATHASCIFCRIIRKEIPSLTIYESPTTLAFLDIGPLSRGHSLVIPKFHGEKLTDVPDEQLVEVLSVAKKIAKALGAENWNLLQNNGRLAHQMVDHVHFHVIPKPNEEEGLGVGWPAKSDAEMKDMGKEDLAKLAEELKSKM